MSLLNPVSNYKRRSGLLFDDSSTPAQTETKQIASSEQTETNQIAASEQTEINQIATQSSNQAEVKPPGSSPPEESKDPASKAHTSDASEDDSDSRPSRSSKFDGSYFPTGQKRQSKKQTTDET